MSFRDAVPVGRRDERAGWEPSRSSRETIVDYATRVLLDVST